MSRLNTLLIIFTVAVVSLAGCGGSSETSQEKPVTSTAKATPAPAGVDKGVGPVTQIDVAALSSEDATQGATIFQEKCTACHKIEERYIGPALTGITKRRAPEWIMNMILNPDVMVKENEAAKALFVEYLAPMTNQNLTEDEARAILAFFVKNDSEIETDGQSALQEN